MFSCCIQCSAQNQKSVCQNFGSKGSQKKESEGNEEKTDFRKDSTKVMHHLFLNFQQQNNFVKHFGFMFVSLLFHVCLLLLNACIRLLRVSAYRAHAFLTIIIQFTLFCHNLYY